MTDVWKVWWPVTPRPGNVGDIITPVILRAFGINAEWATWEKAELIATGSIVGHARPNQTVWGSGAQRRGAKPDPLARYLAVRGPMTRAMVIANGGTCPEVYGDPALLLPRFHNAPVEVEHDVGIVPHYVDRDLVTAGHTIDPIRADPLDVVDEIRACRAIVSSSLHGIIIAHAYGIPAAWVKLSDRLCGDDTKFHDYAASVGVELVPHPTIEDAVPVLGALDTGPLLAALDVLR
jgi:hypothetical protein